MFKYESVAKTKTGKNSVDQAALEKIKTPFVKDLVDLRKILKLNSTYLGQMLREEVDNYIHPFIGFAPVSWRSSVNRPSWQNLSARDQTAVFIVKNGIIPRPGNRFLDSDYSTIEVHGAAWYTHDPKLLDYLWNPASDMHRDATMDCFKLEPDEVHKDARKCGKNSFVFPEFYGDYYVNCATHLWEDIEKYKLVTTKNVLIKDHLKKHGIKTYKQFESHIQEVEDYFWNERFKVYTQWKKDTWNLYLNQGYLESFLGFKFTGSMDRNNSLNYQIQSTAFHCLLWAYTKLARYIRENKLKTILIGETHDSMVKDVPKDEFDHIISITKKIMVDDLIDQFPFIITPIEIEIEATDVDGSWYTKKLIETYRKEPKIKYEF
jgi:DNA polymerase-1